MTATLSHYSPNTQYVLSQQQKKLDNMYYLLNEDYDDEYDDNNDTDVLSYEPNTISVNYPSRKVIGGKQPETKLRKYNGIITMQFSNHIETFCNTPSYDDQPFHEMYYNDTPCVNVSQQSDIYEQNSNPLDYSTELQENLTSEKQKTTWTSVVYKKKKKTNKQSGLRNRTKVVGALLSGLDSVKQTTNKENLPIISESINNNCVLLPITNEQNTSLDHFLLTARMSLCKYVLNQENYEDYFENLEVCMPEYVQNIRYLFNNKLFHKITKTSTKNTITFSDNNASNESVEMSSSDSSINSSSSSSNNNSIENSMEISLSTQRINDKISNVRHVNNFIKSIMITSFVTKVMKSNENYAGHRKILDLGCEKSDMNKWEYAHPEFITFLDISEVGLLEAEHRWRKSKYKFPATFIQADFCQPPQNFLQCFNTVLFGLDPNRRSGESRKITPYGQLVYNKQVKNNDGDDNDDNEILLQYYVHQKDNNFQNVPQITTMKYDVISCQFAAHYAFFSWEYAKNFMQNVSCLLTSGGLFMGSIPDADVIIRLFQNSKDCYYTNEQFSISAYETIVQEQQKTTKVYLPQRTCDKYWFTMNRIIHCKQNLVKFSDFTALAKSFGLRLHYHENFYTFFQQEMTHRSHASIIERMKIDQLQLTNQDKETISLYHLFCFVKE